MVDQSRLGREALDTMLVIRRLERAGVQVWGSRAGKQITMVGMEALIPMIESKMNEQRRRETAPKVREAAMTRHRNGYVVGGRVYGYTNKRTCGGCVKDGVGTCRHPSVRVVNEEQAAVVRRIFEMTRDGMGLAKIRTKLNDERIPGPRGSWATTGVRELLHRRDYIGQIITNRIQRAWDDEAEKGIRVEQPESEWKIRRDESLRIVSDELWQAAHARVQQTIKSYLRRGNQFVGRPESTKGLYLLSGFLSCGVCHKPLIATKRGRDLNLIYACREHRERGDAGCPNATGVPAAELHAAVIASLRKTFTPESFTAHLEKQAADSGAREQRAAERAALIADLPKLAAAEQRLVKRIATVEDDALVDALKAEWQAAKTTREQAERRLAELEGIERDLAADQSEVEALRNTWQSWSATLAKVEGAAPGSIPAEAQQQARQILKKVLVSTIQVTPANMKVEDDAGRPRPAWFFEGFSRFEGVLHGGLLRGVSPFVVEHDDHPGGDRADGPAAHRWGLRCGDAQPTGVADRARHRWPPIPPQRSPHPGAGALLLIPTRPPNARRTPAPPGHSSLSRHAPRESAGPW